MVTKLAIALIALGLASCATVPKPDDAPAAIACDQHGHCVPLNDDELDKLLPGLKADPPPGAEGLTDT